MSVDTKTIVHGASNTSLDDLERRLTIAEQDLKAEERARNRLLLERDRILEFWNVTKTRLAAVKTELRQALHHISEREAEHSIEVKVYRDRIRTLMAEHAQLETQFKSNAAAVALQQELSAQKELALQKSQHHEALHAARIAEQSSEQRALECRIECERRVAAARASFEAEVMRIRTEYDLKLSGLVEAAEARCHSTLHAAGAQRDAALSNMSKQQEAALLEVREHYTGTVTSQLQVISALKSNLEQLKRGEVSIMCIQSADEGSSVASQAATASLPS